MTDKQPPQPGQPCCGHDHGHSHAHAHTHGPGDACSHGGDLATHAPRDVVCLDRVSYRYPGQDGSSRFALRDVTLHVADGCKLGIIGPNGAGKTTLIKILLGLLTNFEGHVSVHGQSPQDACRRGNVIGYVPQRHEAEWRFPVTARQVVVMGLTGKTGLFRRHAADDLNYVDHLMQRVGVTDLANRPIQALSGGQQQRLFIARALAPRPKVLLLDEPMVGIDEAGQRQFHDLIDELHRSLRLTILIVSHDLRAIAAGCERVACLNQTIHYHDAPQGLTPAVLREVFQHEIANVLG
jgi:ABC-type Mn2+/Zn2+ transport system ATPase subunit